MKKIIYYFLLMAGASLFAACVSVNPVHLDTALSKEQSALLFFPNYPDGYFTPVTYNGITIPGSDRERLFLYIPADEAEITGLAVASAENRLFPYSNASFRYSGFEAGKAYFLQPQMEGSLKNSGKKSEAPRLVLMIYEISVIYDTADPDKIKKIYPPAKDDEPVATVFIY